jgi:hypothetical protein
VVRFWTKLGSLENQNILKERSAFEYLGQNFRSSATRNDIQTSRAHGIYSSREIVLPRKTSASTSYLDVIGGALQHAKYYKRNESLFINIVKV